jgi:hypothetical protein
MPEACIIWSVWWAGTREKNAYVIEFETENFKEKPTRKTG